MTILKNLPSIKILKKCKRRDLSRRLFLKNQQAKQRRKLQNGVRIKNKQYQSILSKKVKPLAALRSERSGPFFSMDPFSSVFLEKERKQKYGKRFNNKKAIHIKDRIDIYKETNKNSLTRLVIDSNKAKPVGLTKRKPIFLWSIGLASRRHIPILATKDAKKIQNKYGYRVKVKEGRWLTSVSTARLKKNLLLKKACPLCILPKHSRSLGRKKKLFFKIKDSAQLFTTGKKRLITSKQISVYRKVEYKKYKKKIRLPRQKTPIKIPPGAKIGRISIKGTYNNIILTLTDKEGNTKAWASAGTAGFKNGRKSSHFAAESAADRLADRTIALGYTFARVNLRGLGGGKLKAIRRLCKSKLQLLGVRENVSIAYNGCRRSRKPRK